MSKYIKRIILIICVIASFIGIIKIKMRLDNPSIVINCDIPEEEKIVLIEGFEDFITVTPRGKWILEIKVLGYDDKHIEFVVYSLRHFPSYYSTYTDDFWGCIEHIDYANRKF